ncbi:LOW QUALITY PROTEIN: Retroelement pol Polyprotein [Phytophthora palmivora]|uniref:Retroelement pol Polyprotein n=1 Tax=Phytophthora palmivora TaxID=4796 RepID=A0A2P4X448_9STRA|nr:LOW QUALITY PROTEIN: Retroelement pol Polyprotein [Phytophthora palmivora]
MKFGIKPDLYHIRKYGALAFVHVPVTPGRRKFDINAKLGFVLGYANNVVGCKVYFSDERTAKFVADLRVAEDVVYRDRHDIDAESTDLSSIHFSHSDNREYDNCDEDMASGNGSVSSQSETNALWEEEYGITGNTGEIEGSIGDDRTGIEDKAPIVASAIPRYIRGNTTFSDGHFNGDTNQLRRGFGDGTCGSSVGKEGTVEDERILRNDDITVASIVGKDEFIVADETGSGQSIRMLDEDLDHEIKEESKKVSSHETEPHNIDSSVLLPQTRLRQAGKLTHRDKTASEVERIVRNALKRRTKKTGTGLQEYSEHSCSKYLYDNYMMYATQV